MKSKNVYIYALINPINNHVFYVGASKNPNIRYYAHITQSNYNDGYGNLTSFKNEQIRYILNCDREVEMIILEECEISKASFWEEWYMDLFTSFGFKLSQLRCSSYAARHTVPIGLYFRSRQIKGYRMSHNLINTNKYGVVVYSDTIVTPLYNYNEVELKEFMYKEAAKNGFE